jgi:hypothetical protein
MPHGERGKGANGWRPSVLVCDHAGWNIPEQIPVCCTPLMVTMQGTPLIGIGVGDGDGEADGDADGDALGVAVGDVVGDGTEVGDGAAVGLGWALESSSVWLQIATSWMAQGWVESVALRVTLVVPAGIGVQ